MVSDLLLSLSLKNLTMSKCQASLLSVMLLIFCRAYSQQATIESLLPQLESLAANTETSLDKEDLIKNLDQFARHPLNLNIADGEDLKNLLLLNDKQIASFLSYRQLFGAFVNKYELQAIPGWDIQTIAMLLPFVVIGPSVSSGIPWKKLIENGQNSVLLRVGFSPGIKDQAEDLSKNLGSNYRIFLKYRYAFSNRLQFQWLGDKDAGEQFFRGTNRKGFDFNSFHLQWKSKGLVQMLVAGDFTINMGQGLTQWQGLALSKSTDITSVKRESPVIRPYTSSGESNFCRGLAMSLKWNNWQADVFVSRRKLSGNIDLDSINDAGHISSFNVSGYHRTESEVQKKDNIILASAGMTLGFKTATSAFSMNVIFNKLSKAIRKRPEPYNLFESSGKEFLNASIQYSRGFKNLHFFGEAAIDGHLNNSMLAGAMIAMANNLDFSVVVRSMSRSYNSLFASSFSENQLPSNERGIYTGLTLRGPPGVTTQLYVDYYRFPWLKYRVDAPSSGNEAAILIKFQPDKKTELSCRLKFETKQGNSGGFLPIDPVVSKTKKGFQVQVNYNYSTRISLRTRLETVNYREQFQPAALGFLFFTEVSLTPLIEKWGANLRLQYFDADSYDSRIYAYENIMSHSFGFPAYFDTGIRTYLNLHRSFNLTGKKKKVDLWVRGARTFYSSKDSNTSAALPSKNDVQFQVLYSF